MNVFLQGTDVSLIVPLKDKGGNPISVTTVQCRVTDQDDVEVLAQHSVDSFSEGDSEVVIAVLAASNTLGAGIARALRSVELTCLVEGNTIVINTAYAIELADPLQVGINSFQSYASAEFVSLDIPNTPGWDAATNQERQAALIDARSHIVQLNFTQLNSTGNWGQDSLNYVPEGSYPTNYATQNGVFMFQGDLSLMSAEQFVLLPAKFKKALCLAQVAEADAILGGDPIEDRRHKGILMEAVGEVRQMFRSGKPLELPVSRRALGYISYFVSFSKKIGRG